MLPLLFSNKGFGPIPRPFFIASPVGIEPTSQAPQACVLSIKLRRVYRHCILILLLYKLVLVYYGNILPVAQLDRAAPF